MINTKYHDELQSLLTKSFLPAGHEITKNIELDSVPENSKYEAMNFALNDKNIVYRKAKVTSDRPGAFLAIWKRPPPEKGTKPIPLTSSELDYLIIKVESHSNISEVETHRKKHGVFIFPISLLISKRIVSTEKNKGKTGFRVFPPWSEDRGTVGTQVFSDSGKKTQSWQLPFFLEIDENGLIESSKLNLLLDCNHG